MANIGPQRKYVVPICIHYVVQITSIKLPQKKKVLGEFFSTRLFWGHTQANLIQVRAIRLTVFMRFNWNPNDIYKSASQSFNRWRQISAKYASAKNLNKHCYFSTCSVHMNVCTQKWRDIIEKIALFVVVARAISFLPTSTSTLACLPDLLICTTISLQLFFISPLRFVNIS